LRLAFHGVLNYQKIVFVAHSMGGLVVLRELLVHREVMDRVPVIVFLATPQEGADIARIASHILNNPALSQMRLADANDLLKTLSDEWSSVNTATRPRVRCAYEGLDTYRVRIVPWSSATRFCEGSPPAIQANHIDIAKPDQAGSDAVAVVVTALQDYVFNKALAPKLETPDFRVEGDHFAIDLTSIAPPQVARLVNSGGSSLRFTLAEVSDPLLYLWPNDTPKELAANGREDMHIGLGFGATGTEYRFVLRTDVEPDRHVTVHVPNLPALRAQERKLAQDVTTALENLIGGPTQGPQISRADAESPEVLDLVVRTARDTVARMSPQLPDSGKWVLTADFLNAINWPTLAARALRQAERASPGVALNAGVQTLAAKTAYMSGESKVFQAGAAQILDPAERERVIGREGNLLVSEVGVSRATVFASKLQQVPALKVYGYSLQGDAQAAAGDTAGAKESLEAASKVRPTPSLTHRLEAVSRR
jgi:pimeloyl-ACP methyl ester carboxylesterase